MQDPDRRGRRARCAALIQGCRVHEWSWNAPSSFSKHQRAVAPVVQRAASCPGGRSVDAPFERAPVALLRGFIFWHSWGSSAHQLTVLQNNLRHTARTNTNTSAATTIQINAFCGSGGGGRGGSVMALLKASRLRWSNKSRKRAQGPQGAEGAYDRCCGHLPPCCARATRSRLIRSSTSLCS
jgi:hypothetical protein